MAEPILAVVFDWGGTLSEYAVTELEDMWRLAARHLAPHTHRSEDELTAELTAVEVRFWERTSSHSTAGTLAELLAEATAVLKVDVAEALLEEAAVHYLDAWTPHIRHDPEAAGTLRELRQRGIKIALLSNTHWPRAFHERFLARDGLVELIEARLYTSEMARMKPHPDAFRAALAAVGVTDPTRAVMVGDRPFDDIYGAQSLGMKGVLRPNPKVPGYAIEPSATIARLPELLDLVDGWSR